MGRGRKFKPRAIGSGSGLTMLHFLPEAFCEAAVIVALDLRDALCVFTQPDEQQRGVIQQADTHDDK